jgi:hypothetical protein
VNGWVPVPHFRGRIQRSLGSSDEWSHEMHSVNAGDTPTPTHTWSGSRGANLEASHVPIAPALDGLLDLGTQKFDIPKQRHLTIFHELVGFGNGVYSNPDYLRSYTAKLPS